MSLSLMLNEDGHEASWEEISHDWFVQEPLQFPGMFTLPSQEPSQESLSISDQAFQGLDPIALHEVQDGVARWADIFISPETGTVATSSTTGDLTAGVPTYRDSIESDLDYDGAVSSPNTSGDISGTLGADLPTCEAERSEDIVCYGMLFACEVKLARQDLRILDAKLCSSAPIDQQHIQKLSLPSTVPHILRLADGTNFGTLREAVVKTLQSLNQFSAVDVEIIGSTPVIREQLQKVAKPEEALVRVNINIYGPRHLSEEVGNLLSKGKCWLQRPDYFRTATKYENPHFISFPGLDEQHVVEDVRKELPTSKPKVQEERLRELVSEVHSSLSRATELEKVTGDQRLKITLLEHQQKALAYMLQRESGDIPDRYRLWEKSAYGGQEMFIHRITKSRSLNQPEESGGGVLADEMGMGKTLSSLALLVHTLEDGHKWEMIKSSEEHRSGRIECWSHATLVVVPSALLINNWNAEINMHLGDTVKVVKYHGRSRIRDLETLRQSDIVLTTYNTLAAEFAPRRSPTLHKIGWYRLILDEAHIIRRQATSFYRACADLEARSRWCLTGTPIQNRLDDIGALFAFLRARPFHKIAQFRRFISVPFEHGETVSRDRLILLYESLCLRRTKDILELPGQSECLRKLELTAKERDQYTRTVNILNRYMRTQVGQNIYEEDYLQLHQSHQAWNKNSNMRFGLFQAHMQLRILCNHGTFQKPFSWKKRDLKDANDAMIAELGPRSDALCDGCKQPSPVLGLTRERNTFVERCAHVLCQECLEDSAQLPMVGSMMHCPLCHRLGRAFANATDSTGNDEDIEMEDAPNLSTLASEDHRRHSEYFNTVGISTKMNALVRDIKMGMEASKGIVFSCWTRTLDLIARHLEAEKIEYLRIDGECLQSRRQPIIDRYATDPGVRMLLMTTGTGAFGLNLTAASRIFIVEPQWNPSTENQAIARAIRLRQEREVEVIRYVIQDTVEEEMRSQQDKKRNVAQAVLGSGSDKTVE